MIIGWDVFSVCNLYLISVEIVGCCNRLITSFNGGFFTIIADDEGGETTGGGQRMREGAENFCLQLNDSSTLWLSSDVAIASSSSSSSLSVSHRLLSSSLNNG